MAHAAKCVLTGRADMPGAEGLQDQRIMEAIHRFATENRPIALDPVAGLYAFRDPMRPTRNLQHPVTARAIAI